jgi:hypothetical protein
VGPTSQSYARFYQSEKARGHKQYQRQRQPDRNQYRLAPHIEAHFDGLLVPVRRLIDAVKSPWFKEDVSRLARHHTNCPTDQTRRRRVKEQQAIGD